MLLYISLVVSSFFIIFLYNKSSDDGFFETIDLKYGIILSFTGIIVPFMVVMFGVFTIIEIVEGKTSIFKSITYNYETLYRKINYWFRGIKPQISLEVGKTYTIMFTNDSEPVKILKKQYGLFIGDDNLQYYFDGMEYQANSSNNWRNLTKELKD